MSLTPITTSGSQPYQVNISGEAGNIQTADNIAVKAAIAGLSAGQLEQIEKKLLGEKTTIGFGNPRNVSKQEQQDALRNFERVSSSDIVIDSLAYMKLFQQCAQQMRNAARQQRIGELTAQISALNAVAAEMKTAADQKLAAGIAQGVAGIVAGCVQIGAGAIQVGQAAKAFNASNQAAEFQQQASLTKKAPGIDNDISAQFQKVASQFGNQATKLSSQSQATGAIGAGIAGVISSSGNLAASVLNYESDMANKRKTEDETEAKIHETAVQHANDMMQNMEEIIRDVREKVAAIQQAEAETARGITRNI